MVDEGRGRGRIVAGAGAKPGRAPCRLTRVFLPSSSRSLTRLNPREQESTHALGVIVTAQLGKTAGQLHPRIVLERTCPIGGFLPYELGPGRCPAGRSLHNRTQQQEVLSGPHPRDERRQVLLWGGCP